MKAHLWICLFLAALALFPSFADPTDMVDIQARAAKGDAGAELDLARAYHLGNGVPQDFIKAAGFYSQAAAQGSAKAMYNLGYLYDHGQGVTKDSSVAAQWFQKSADRGLPAGQLQMGLAYFFGDDGVKQDYAAAAKWLTLAAEQQKAPAQSAPAANALGSLCEHGQGVPMDGKQAVLWYTIGAELGYGKAQSNLGRIEDDGLHVKRDRIQSYKWLKLAALQGDSLAIHLLAEYLAGKEFSAKEMTEGDGEVRKYQEAHHLPTNAIVTLAADPNALPPVVKSPDAAASATATKASPTAIAPSMTPPFGQKSSGQ